MHRLTALDEYTIAGVGRALVVESPVEFKRQAALQTFAPEVEIDGVVYAVRGVESFCVPTIRKGAPISILVGATSRRPSLFPAT